MVFDSDYLDLAIGLAVVFFLASLVVSGLHEALAWVTRVRAKFLWAYLSDLTTNGSAKLPRSFGGTLNLMFLWLRARLPGGRRAALQRDARPLTGATVADADLLAHLLRSLRPIDSPAVRPEVGTGTRTTVKNIPPSSLVQGLLEAFAGHGTPGAPTNPSGRELVERGVAMVQGAPLEASLRRLWATSGEQIDVFRGQLEEWLAGEMNRLGGLYRRSIRLLLLILSFVVAVALNIDAISLTTSLWRNPEGRAALVALADDVSAGGSGDTDAEGATVAGLEQVRRLCLEQAGPADGDEVTSPEEAAAAVEAVRTCVTDALNELRGLDVVDRSLLVDPGRFWDDVTPWGGDTSGAAWARHWLGVLATMLALFVGAPFWFDLLKRLTGARRGLVGET